MYILFWVNVSFLRDKRYLNSVQIPEGYKLRFRTVWNIKIRIQKFNVTATLSALTDKPINHFNAEKICCNFKISPVILIVTFYFCNKGLLIIKKKSKFQFWPRCFRHLFWFFKKRTQFSCLLGTELEISRVI